MWQETHNLNLGGIYLQVIETNKDGSGIHAYYNSSDINRTFTVNKSLYNYRVSIQTGTIAQAGTFMNYKNRYMIYKGTDEKEFELYGASPSPEYPSPVVCLGSNKNIFDGVLELGNIDTSTGQNSEHFNIIRSKNYNELNGEKEVTVTGIPNFYFFTYTEDKAYIESTYENPITIPENARYFKLRTWNSDNITDINTKIKVEEGDKATSYSPFGQGSTLISKINKNVLEKPENSTSSGVGITVNYENGKYIINGMTTEGCYLKLNKELLANTFAQSSNWQKSKLKPGEYVFSIKTISGNTNSENINIFLRNATSKAVFNQEIDKVSKPGSLSKSFLIEEEQDYFCYLWMPGSITFTNFTFSVMLEKGTELTELTENQQTDYILNIQQEMLEGDYFIKEDDGWKEVHNWNKIVLNNTETIERVDTSVSGKYRFAVTVSGMQTGNFADTEIIDNLISNELTVVSNNITWNCAEDNAMHIRINNTPQIIIYIEKCSQMTVDEFKAFLQELYDEGKAIEIYYKLATPTKLPCTKEQSAVLEELNNLDLFEGVNNIITAEDIALLKLKYALDVKTYVDNQLANVNAQILNIAGGN